MVTTTRTVGDEFQVNTFSEGGQSGPLVSSLSDGGFVVVWSSWEQDGDSHGVYGQRYDENGNLEGTEFQVNTYTNGQQIAYSIAGLKDGGFVVTWRSEFQNGSDYDIYGRRYLVDGSPEGGEFRVNTDTIGTRGNSATAALNDGGFVIVWQVEGQDGAFSSIYGQRYNFAGSTVGNEFQVNTFTQGTQYIPSVTGLSDGGFVVTWSSSRSGGESENVYGQRYSAGGSIVGGEFQVNTFVDDPQSYSSISGLSDGGFVVVWHSEGQDGTLSSIYGQRYNFDGSTVGNEFQVNTFTQGTQYIPSVTGLSDGQFVVMWSSEGQDGDGFGVYGQRYTANGSVVGDEFQVNTYTENHQNETRPC